jgi:hypothetical protein
MLRYTHRDQTTRYNRRQATPYGAVVKKFLVEIRNLKIIITILALMLVCIHGFLFVKEALLTPPGECSTYPKRDEFVSPCVCVCVFLSYAHEESTVECITDAM